MSVPVKIRPRPFQDINKFTSERVLLTVDVADLRAQPVVIYVQESSHVATMSDEERSVVMLDMSFLPLCDHGLLVESSKRKGATLFRLEFESYPSSNKADDRLQADPQPL